MNREMREYLFPRGLRKIKQVNARAMVVKMACFLNQEMSARMMARILGVSYEVVSRSRIKWRELQSGKGEGLAERLKRNKGVKPSIKGESMSAELMERINRGEEVVIDAHEYGEEFPVCLGVVDGELVVEATNEGGHNGTSVNLRQLLKWVARNAPELLEEAKQ